MLIDNQNNDFKQKAYDEYVSSTFFRFTWLSAIIAVGEGIMMLLDISGGFFDEHPINILNLWAEIFLIFTSILIFIICKKEKKEKQENQLKIPQKEAIIVAYRVVLMLSVILFIISDIVARQKLLGPYLVFLFALQVTPAFKSRVNWIQFMIFGVFVTVLGYNYMHIGMNSLVSTLVIFLCFAVSTDFLRSYFIRQMENYHLAEYNNECYKRLSHQTVLALANAVEAKDKYTKGHSMRVALYSSEIAERMGYVTQDCQDVYFIGLMHDIGKIGVRDSVINKNAKLTDEEYAEIKQHPAKGYEILKKISEMKGISEGARWHHERFDGRGYPDGLAGKDIPEIARIIAVADAYDAMTSNRSYRGLMPQAEVRKQIETNAGTQFDPDIAKIMLDMIDADEHYMMHE